MAIALIRWLASIESIPERESKTVIPKDRVLVRRRAVLRGGLAAGAIQIVSPFVVKSLADEPVKIGFDNPLTGAFAALGKNELVGCQLARDQINASGGVLGRPIELVEEDSTSDDVGVAVEKALKLIDRDKVNFLLGNINSALAAAMAEVSRQKAVFHVDPGGHADLITGTNCHWNVFRVCNPTQTQANALARDLIKSAGKRWYYITSDYAFGHTLQAGLEKACAALGGSKVDSDLVPVGETDFASHLTKAQGAGADAVLLLLAGDDLVNALKTAAQLGVERKTRIAGVQQELEVLLGLPPEARIGTWVFEWYWKQPGVPRVAEFVAEVRKRTDGHVPTARTWFGYAATWTCALAARAAKSLDAVKMAKSMQGFRLPPEISLMPDGASYRAAQNQLMPDLYVGNALAQGDDPEDLFEVAEVVKADSVAGSLEQTGCKLTWPD
jgi:branched-chain amino acid transport system substrate-binding protein